MLPNLGNEGHVPCHLAAETYESMAQEGLAGFLCITAYTRQCCSFLPVPLQTGSSVCPGPTVSLVPRPEPGNSRGSEPQAEWRVPLQQLKSPAFPEPLLPDVRGRGTLLSGVGGWDLFYGFGHRLAPRGREPWLTSDSWEQARCVPRGPHRQNSLTQQAFTKCLQCPALSCALRTLWERGRRSSCPPGTHCPVWAMDTT